MGRRTAPSRRVTLAMLDGSRAEPVVCTSCELSPENLMQWWLRNQMAHLDGNRDRPETLFALRKAVSNIPLGVLRVTERTL